MEPDQVGVRLRYLRKKYRLSLRDLAGRTGLSHSFLSQIENGIRSLSLENLDQLARYFEVSADYFLGRTDHPTAPKLLEDTKKDPQGWPEDTPQWLKDLYDDPDFQPYVGREDVRQVMLDPLNRLFLLSSSKHTRKAEKTIILDILRFTAWRLDQVEQNGDG